MGISLYSGQNPVIYLILYLYQFVINSYRGKIQLHWGKMIKVWGKTHLHWGKMVKPWGIMHLHWGKTTKPWGKMQLHNGKIR